MTPRSVPDDMRFGNDHERFEELAAGHALDALEPDEAHEFEAHLAGCDDCAAMLADFRDVAGMLAETAPSADPSPELGTRLQQAAAADLGLVDGVAAVVTLRPRRRRTFIGAAAAAVVLLAGGVTSAVVIGGGSSSVSCVAASGCHQIALVSSVGQVDRAQVDVQGDNVSVSPKNLSPNTSGKTVYVLWQLTAKQPPVAVASFDVFAGSKTPVAIGKLARPYAATLAFAVSEEPGTSIPTTPSHILGVGAVTA
jgi:anti-sigma-K factor RskA